LRKDFRKNRGGTLRHRGYNRWVVNTHQHRLWKDLLTRYSLPASHSSEQKTRILSTGNTWERKKKDNLERLTWALYARLTRTKRKTPPLVQGERRGRHRLLGVKSWERRGGRGKRPMQSCQLGEKTYPVMEEDLGSGQVG